MKNMLREIFADRSVEEIIFSIILLLGIPYFTVNEIIDLLTNQSLIVFTINVFLLITIVYLLRLSLKKKLTGKHIFGFSLILVIAFTLFWPSSTGLSGPGAYVFQSLLVVLLLINSGKSRAFFAIYLLTMILIAGFYDIQYKGKIVYTNQLISFILNTVAIAFVMNVFKTALERERKQMVKRINQLENMNEKLTSHQTSLEKNHMEISRIQTQLQEIIAERTEEIERENQRMIEYAFINAHLVRAPLANLLGLIELKSEENNNFQGMKEKAEKLDSVVRKIGGILSITKNEKTVARSKL